jgi:hypothetical protein
MDTRMVRKQIYIKKRQNILLKQLSQARGLSEAEIIRQAIERETTMGRAFTRDRTTAWVGIMRFVQERKQAQAGGGKPVEWDRQEIYEDREVRRLGAEDQS